MMLTQIRLKLSQLKQNTMMGKMEYVARQSISLTAGPISKSSSTVYVLVSALKNREVVVRNTPILKHD